MNAYANYRAIQDPRDKRAWTIQKKLFGFWTNERFLYGDEADVQKVLDATVSPRVLYPSETVRAEP